MEGTRRTALPMLHDEPAHDAEGLAKQEGVPQEGRLERRQEGRVMGHAEVNAAATAAREAQKVADSKKARLQSVMDAEGIDWTTATDVLAESPQGCIVCNDAPHYDFGIWSLCIDHFDVVAETVRLEGSAL